MRSVWVAPGARAGPMTRMPVTVAGLVVVHPTVLPVTEPGVPPLEAARGSSLSDAGAALV